MPCFSEVLDIESRTQKGFVWELWRKIFHNIMYEIYQKPTWSIVYKIPIKISFFISEKKTWNFKLKRYQVHWMPPKRWRLWPVYFRCPPELNLTILLKAPHTLVAWFRENEMEFLPSWLNFHCARMLFRENHLWSYPVVNSAYGKPNKPD